MKIRLIILSFLAGAVVLFMTSGSGLAKSKSETLKSARHIGVVSIQKIMRNSKRSAAYREKAIAEYGRMKADLEKMGREIEAQKAGLEKLKSGSSDYMVRLKEMLEKQGSLRAREEFYKQQMTMQEQKLTEELYKDILLKVKQVAAQKGLDIVFEQSEPEFPMTSASELTLTISTHKVLYSAGYLDISDEVLAKLDE